jgi:hypothetical protein
MPAPGLRNRPPFSPAATATKAVIEADAKREDQKANDKMLYSYKLFANSESGCAKCSG